MSREISLDPTTFRSLEAFGRRRRRLLVARGLAAGLVTWSAAVALVAFADQTWWLSDGARWVLSLAAYAAAAVAAWRFGLGGWRPADRFALARHIESIEPRLRNQLLAAVELADPQWANGSPSFRHRLQRRVAQRIGSLDARRLLPVTLIRGWIWTLTGLAALTLFFALIPSLQLGRRLARAAIPGARIERASLTKLQILRPMPPSQQVAEGDSIGVVAAVGGKPADDVFLQWRSAEGPPGEAVMLARESDELADPSEQDMLGFEPHALLAANLPIGSQPVSYRVLAGDAATLWHTLTPAPRPRVESFEIRYRFPNYSGLPDETAVAERGDLRAFVGSTAIVTVRFDQPVRDAVVRFGSDGAESEMQPLDATARRFRDSIPIKTAGVYQIDATSVESGITNPFSPQYSITPVVDEPPSARWGDDVAETTLVSPLEVLRLTGSAEDDMPLEDLIQEYQINNEPTLRREIPVGSPARTLTESFTWDLLHPERSPRGTAKQDGAAQQDGAGDDEAAAAALEGSGIDPPLRGGDRVRSRLLAIDRHGRMGRSRVVQFLVVDEGFDSRRHDPLNRHGAAVAGLLAWLEQSRGITEQLAEVAQRTKDEEVLTPAEASERLTLIEQQVRELRGSADAVGAAFTALLSSSQAPVESSNLEMLGATIDTTAARLRRAHADLDAWWPDDETGQAVGDGEQWSRWRTAAAGDIHDEARRLQHLNDHAEELARASLGHAVAKGMFRDVEGLRRSLEPLIRDEARVPPTRIGRYVEVALGRLREIDELLQRHAESLPAATRRHHENWFRVSDAWQNRLRRSLEAAQDPNRWRVLLEEFQTELAGQARFGTHDSRQVSQFVESSLNLHRRRDTFAESLRDLRRLGERWETVRRQRGAETDSKRLGEVARAEAVTEAAFRRAVTGLQQELESREAWQRKRPRVDLAFAADLNLLGRALSNATGDGYAPYRGQPPAEVLNTLATAIAVLESRHGLQRSLRELQALIEGERYSEESARLEIDHPTWIARYPALLGWPCQQLRQASVPPDKIEPIESTGRNERFELAQRRISSRRWSADPPVSAAAPLAENEATFRQAVADLADEFEAARESIRQYVLSLPEQARQAAQRAEEAAKVTRERPDSRVETAEELAQRQSRAEQAARATIQTLNDMANNADPLDAAARELARDADAAAEAIRSGLESAAQARGDAAAAGDPEARGEALDEAAEAFDRVAQSLRQTADHFEAAEAGRELAASREQLREQEAASESRAERESDFRQTESLARDATESPRELLQRLEAELAENEPMREELDDISEGSAEAALRGLQRAAAEEAALNRSLENSDSVLLEQKRRLRQRLQDAAEQARVVERHLLDAAERAVNWSNDPESRNLIQRVQRELGEAASQVEQLGGDETLLEDLARTGQRLGEAIGRAGELTNEVKSRTGESSDEDLHRTPQRRQQTVREMDRVARDARQQLARAASERRSRWAEEKMDAGRRIQQIQQRQRAASRQQEQAADRLREEPNDPAAIERLGEAERQLGQLSAAERATRETRELAETEEQAAEQAARQLARTGLEPLKKPNPAAELAQRLTGEAALRLEGLEEALSRWTEDADIGQQLRIPPADAERLQGAQSRVAESVRESVNQLERAARHQGRLGQSRSAEQLAEAAQEIARGAEAELAAAGDAISDARRTPEQSPTANRAVGDASEALASQARRLARLLAEQAASQSGQPDRPEAAGRSADGKPQPSPEQQQGRELARTLDELDRALHGESSEASSTADSDQPSQQSGSQQGGGAEPSSGEDASDGEAAPSRAVDASPTLASAVDDQVQQAARRRQARSQPGSSSEGQPGQESTGAGSPTGSRGGPVAIDDIDRIGAAWGQLREQRTEEVVEGRQLRVAPQYRREVEAYFQAIAKQADGRDREDQE